MPSTQAHALHGVKFNVMGKPTPEHRQSQLNPW